MFFVVISIGTVQWSYLELTGHRLIRWWPTSRIDEKALGLEFAKLVLMYATIAWLTYLFVVYR